MWFEGRDCVALIKAKIKNSNSNFSTTSPFQLHWLCRSSASQAALWLFLPGHPPAPWLRGFSSCQPQSLFAQVLCSSSANKAFLLLTEKLRLLLFWQASFPPTYAFSASSLSSPAKTHLSWITFSPFPFHTPHIKWFLCESSKYPGPKTSGRTSTTCSGFLCFPLNRILPQYKTICVECFHPSCKRIGDSPCYTSKTNKTTQIFFIFK